MQQIGTQRVLDKTQLGGLGDPLGIVQEMEVGQCEKMVYAQHRISPGEWDVLTPVRFWDTNGSPNDVT